jgi:predicted PurR-regulated permease PerM
MPDFRLGGVAPSRPGEQASAARAADRLTVFVFIVATLYLGKEVLMPVTLALLLAFVLSPLVNLLRRARLGNVPSVLLGVALALCVILAIGGVIGGQIAQLATDIPKYSTTVEGKISSLKSYTIGRLSALTDKVGSQQGRSAGGQQDSSSSQQAAQPSAQEAPAPQGSSGSSPLEIAENYLTPVLSPFATFGIVFIVAVFALLQKEDLRDRMIRLVGSEDLHGATVAIDDGASRLHRYFLTQLLLNVSFGVAIGAGLLLIGLPNPVLWGILSAMLRFVPYVGSILSAVLPVALAAAVDPGWSLAIWTIGLYLVLEAVTGQVIEPLVYGNSTGLSPFSVVVAAIFWSWLWGPVGLILSTPLSLCLVVIGRHVKQLAFLDIMLGDRPPLTLTETLYQSILAGDVDEAQEHAELVLKERSLGTYYDEIVVKAMQLAANDADRGFIDRNQLDQASRSIRSLMSSLDAYKDERPPSHKVDKAATSGDGPDLPVDHDPRTGPPPGSVLPPAWVEKAPLVLCVAGRGSLDGTTSFILAQLLGKHGFTTRVISHKEVSREEVDTLETTGVAIACISMLDVSGNPAHIRYLTQRLRQRLPSGTPILVGLWPKLESAHLDHEAREATGADVLAGSLENMVDLCIQSAIRLDEQSSLAEANHALATDSHEAPAGKHG